MQRTMQRTSGVSAGSTTDDPWLDSVALIAVNSLYLAGVSLAEWLNDAVFQNWFYLNMFLVHLVLGLLLVLYILHEQSLEDFLLRNNLPVSEQQLVEQHSKFWKYLESLSK